MKLLCGGMSFFPYYMLDTDLFLTPVCGQADGDDGLPGPARGGVRLLQRVLHQGLQPCQVGGAVAGLDHRVGDLHHQPPGAVCVVCRLSPLSPGTVAAGQVGVATNQDYQREQAWR